MNVNDAVAQPGLAEVLRRASEQLLHHAAVRDRDVLLGQLVENAVTMINGASGGGISRTDERRVRSSHATDQAVYDMDQLQDRLGEGPCIQAANDPPPNGTVYISDLAGTDGESWPQFAPQAVAAGYRSILSASLTGEPHQHRSALNLYAEQPHAFSDRDQVLLGLYASHAGALLYGADHAAQLAAAVASRDVIGQAKGILMERFSLDDGEQAFEMLVRSSQETNIKLVDVAAWLVEESAQRHRTRQE